MSEIWGPYRGVVDQVHDGDTVYVKLDVGFDLTIYARVRIEGINAPELSTAAGKVSRQFAESVLPVGATVIVTSYKWDKYGGRIDGDIEIVSPKTDLGTDFATIMLNAGEAVPYP